MENQQPYHIAIVGAGPAGFFTAERLMAHMKLEMLHIDFFERLPRPFGLVEYGVAPDHDRLKQAVKKQFTKILTTPAVRFFG
ncbi:MAG: FAD/NAD(P)-binding protein, partial [Chlamydiota bacterium]|nr:FAD/NAD(P)-binding protein [Chlamydiota bacterium]